MRKVNVYRYAKQLIRTYCVLALASLVWPGVAAAGVRRPPCGNPALEGSFSLRVFRDTDGLPQDTVQSLSLDARGFLWAATQDGAAYYDGRLWTAVPLPERQMEDDFIRCVLGTADGSVWLGTRSNGLYRYRNGRWTWFRREFVGSGHRRVNALL